MDKGQPDFDKIEAELFGLATPIEIERIRSNSLFRPISPSSEEDPEQEINPFFLFALLDLPPLLLAQQRFFTRAVAKIDDLDAVVENAGGFTSRDILDVYAQKVPEKNLRIPSDAVAQFQLFLVSLRMCSTGVDAIMRCMEQNPQMTEAQLLHEIKSIVKQRRGKFFSRISRSTKVAQFYNWVLMADNLQDLIEIYDEKSPQL